MSFFFLFLPFWVSSFKFFWTDTGEVVDFANIDFFFLAIICYFLILSIKFGVLARIIGYIYSILLVS